MLIVNFISVSVYQNYGGGRVIDDRQQYAYKYDDYNYNQNQRYERGNRIMPDSLPSYYDRYDDRYVMDRLPEAKSGYHPPPPKKPDTRYVPVVVKKKKKKRELFNATSICFI